MFKTLCCFAMLFSLSSLSTVAQNQRGVPPGLGGMPNAASQGAANQGAIAPEAPIDLGRTQWELQAAQHENQNRQVAMRQDTDKLLQLATELKQNVDRTGPNILSMYVVKKAQEIEKLAKSVKDKMRGD